MVQIEKFCFLPCAGILWHFQGPCSRGARLYEHGITSFRMLVTNLICCVLLLIAFTLSCYCLILICTVTSPPQLLYLCSCPNSKEGVLRALSLVMEVEVSQYLFCWNYWQFLVLWCALSVFTVCSTTQWCCWQKWIDVTVLGMHSEKFPM